MKKLLIFITLMLIVSSMKGTSLKAYEPLPYWYDTSISISKFSQSTVSYNIVRYLDCDMTHTNLYTYGLHAVDVWDDELAVDFEASTSGTSELGCISRAAAELDNAPAYAAGFGGTGPRTYVITFAKPGGGIAKYYTHTTGYTYLIWDDDDSDGTSQTSDFNASEWKNVSAHEWGHAIGFAGHNTMGTSTLMYYMVTTNIEPQYYDIRHMGLVYAME